MILWRVDDELLTVNPVIFESFLDAPPTNNWFPAMVGDGCYAYFETEAEAVGILKEEIKSKIENLQEKLESLGN